MRGKLPQGYVFRLRLRFLSGNLLFLQKIKHELRRTTRSRQRFASAVAAVDYGADAVYIGGAKFGARHAAGNSAEQIARVAEYAHRYGVRVHATLNTLIYDDELETAERRPAS